jgi:hypothetical protein
LAGFGLVQEIAPRCVWWGGWVFFDKAL